MERLPESRGLNAYRIPDEEILRELALGAKPREMVCLGCAAKVPLVKTVYPVLDELRGFLDGSRIRFQGREDGYIFETDGEVALRRGTYPLQALSDGNGEAVTRDLQEHRPDGVVLLASLTALPTREQFKRAMIGFYEAAMRADHPFTVGKGHTIQISKAPQDQYLVADYFRSSGSRLYGVANNDTISTIDPNLRHSSWISVFIALNNALNDLFLSGVHRALTVYPTCDSPDPAEIPVLREAVSRYAARFSSLGIRVVDLGPIGFRTKSNGATVVGVTDREIPSNRNLQPGQLLLATRPIGDLAPLTEYLIRQSMDEGTEDLEGIRLRVLSQMLIPNLEVGRLIARFLPAKGEPFDPERHITSARDMSGPGLLAIEELAQDSGMDVYLNEVRLHAEWIPEVSMDNPTSGTNGAIILSASPRVARAVRDELEALGCAPWVIGRVAGRSTRPTILVSRELARYRFLAGRKMGLFERWEFVPPREAALA